MNRDQTRRVLVTRPEPGATATARRLASAGFAPAVLPLCETRPLPAVSLEGKEFDAVAATSAHALRWTDPVLLEAIREKPFFAVGARTGSAARRAGFASVDEAGGDAAALVGTVLSHRKIRSLLYLCGRVRRPDFEAALAAGGASVFPVETYDTAEISYEPEHLTEAVGGKPVQAVLLYSVLAAQAYRHLLESPAARPLFEEAVALTLSPRILSALPGGSEGLAAAEPNEDALFALLEHSTGSVGFP